MHEATRSAKAFRFGVFELDPEAGELRKHGLKIKLQEKPLQILAVLLEHPGEVVTREELRQRLWEGGTFVDFDHGVDAALNKLRKALGDSAESPRFIETLPRRGYRFIGTVSGPSHVRAAPPRAAPGGLRVAVLPLENLSGDPAEEYFADGTTEELITQLGGLYSAWLGVIARTSTMKYKQTKKGIDEIGRELEVEYIVEGSVRRTRRRVRISVQLIQVSDQTHLWAQSYERGMGGILAIQSEVARAVARAIQAQLATAQREHPAWPRHATSPGAYEAYLKGRYYLNRASLDDHKKAREYFQQAVDRDPLCAAAYAGTADTYAFQARYHGLPNECAEKAKTAIDKALALEPDLGGAHASLAIIKAWNDWDWAGAEAEFRRAIELNPGSSDTHRVYGEFLALMGRCEQAISEVRQGRELDPLSCNANYDVAFALYISRRPDEAIEQLREVLELDRRFPPAHLGLAHLYAFQSRYEEALAELAEAGARPEYVAWIHALAGEEAQARKAMAGALGKEGPVPSPVSSSVVYFLLGEKARAFESLERAYEQHDWLMIFLKTLPPFDPMRSDPHFQDILRRMDFPE